MILNAKSVLIVSDLLRVEVLGARVSEPNRNPGENL